MNTWNENELVNYYTPKDALVRMKDYDCVSRMLEERLKEYAENVAVIDDGKEYTFAELDKRQELSERNL